MKNKKQIIEQMIEERLEDLTMDDLIKVFKKGEREYLNNLKSEDLINEINIFHDLNDYDDLFETDLKD